MPNYSERDTRQGFPTFGTYGPLPSTATTGRGGMALDALGNAQLLDDAGNAQFSTSLPGTANATRQFAVSKTAIPTTTATSIARVTIPNANHSAVIRLLFGATIADTASAYQSSRVVEVQAVLTRVAGGSAAIAISSVVGGQIATVSAGATFTVATTVTSVSGGGTATQTADIQVAFTPSAGTPNFKILGMGSLVNMEASGVTIAAV